MIAAPRQQWQKLGSKDANIIVTITKEEFAQRTFKDYPLAATVTVGVRSDNSAKRLLSGQPVGAVVCSKLSPLSDDPSHLGVTLTCDRDFYAKTVVSKYVGVNGKAYDVHRRQVTATGCYLSLRVDVDDSAVCWEEGQRYTLSLPFTMDQRAFYQRIHANKDPRDIVVEAIDHFAREGRHGGSVLSVGCGSHCNSQYLLAKGWQVYALDNDKDVMPYLFADATPQRLDEQTYQAGSMTFHYANMEDFAYGEKRFDLVEACLSINMCDKGAIDRVMQSICKAIKPGGRFCGIFNGSNDDRAKKELYGKTTASMTFMTETQVKSFCAKGFVIETYRSEEYDGPTAAGQDHWHVHKIIAKKSAT